MADLIGVFGNIGYVIAAFVIALSIIVAIHEYGHYIVGRWCGIHAEVFSLGFGPVLASGVDKRGTKWQIAAIPLGGYVKFLGDANAASVGSEDVAPEVDPRRTMMGAPLWARAATVAAGPIFNFILSSLIFAGVILYQGRPSDPVQVSDLVALPPAYVNEIEVGDRIIEVAGQPVSTFVDVDAVADELATDAQVIDYRVVRNGQEIDLRGPYPTPTLVRGLSPNSAAYEAGFEQDDVIVAIDGEPVFAFAHIVEAVAAAEGAPLLMDVWRDGEIVEITLTPRQTDEYQADGTFQQFWRIGITGEMFFDPATDSVGVGEAVSLGVNRVGEVISSSIKGLYHMTIGTISTCNLSSPVGIAQASGAMASQGMIAFVIFVGVISTAVGLLNLFPIPVLDGGHLVFHAYEAVTRRPPSEKALQVLMATGLSIILTMMVFALANDLFLCP